jgi:hypothetical protein
LTWRVSILRAAMSKMLSSVVIQQQQ